MKKVMQEKIGKDEIGDCWSACLASIFEIELEAVPHFAKYGSEWFSKFDAWLKEGYGLTAILINARDDERKPYHINAVPALPVYNFPPQSHYILSGKSPRGDYDHAMVYCGEKFVHDPYPGGGGELDDVRDFCVFLKIF